MEEHNTLLIAGIDPGTTKGYALLDLYGNVIELNSSKLLDEKKLIRAITQIGLPLAMGYDKAKVPWFVAKISARLGTRLIGPRKDLLVNEKKRLTAGLCYKNDHERDALAGAIFAQKRLSSLVDKIDRFSSKEKAHDMACALKKFMILSDNTISIKNAFEILKEPKVKKEVVRAITQRDFAKEYARLFKKHMQLKNDYANITRQMEKQKTVMKSQKQPLQKVDIQKKLKHSLEFKDRKLDSQGKDIHILEGQLETEKKKRQELLKIIPEIDRYSIAKIFHNLGAGFIKKSRGISRGDIIYIKDSSIISQKSLAKLKESEIILVAASSRNLKDITVMNPKDLNIKIIDRIAFIEKKGLNSILSKRNLLSKIISDYKRRR